MSFDYVIDAFAWLEYNIGSERGTKIRDVIEKADIATSIITIAELADKFHREKFDFEPFLLFVQSRSSILPITLSIATHAGKLKHKMREKSKDFSLADAIILQTAIENNARIVTGDSDFASVQDAVRI